MSPVPACARRARACASRPRPACPPPALGGAYLRTANISSLLGSSSSGGFHPRATAVARAVQRWWRESVCGRFRCHLGAGFLWWQPPRRGRRRGRVEASEANVADATVSLTAEVAQSYIELCDARQRLALTQQNIDIESHLVEMMKLRRAGGTATDLDVVRVTNQLDTTRATLPAIRAAITEQLNRLAALTAHAPGALDAELANVGPVPAPPATTEYRRSGLAAAPQTRHPRRGAPVGAAHRRGGTERGGAISQGRPVRHASALPPPTPKTCSTAATSRTSPGRCCNGARGISGAIVRASPRPMPHAMRPKPTIGRPS